MPADTNSVVLSSWKEIAAYLGKGVRTVQRWERELGLPVRRPIEHNKRIVIALPADLDQWIHRQLPRTAAARPLDRTRVRELRALSVSLMEKVKQLRESTRQLVETARRNANRRGGKTAGR